MSVTGYSEHNRVSQSNNARHSGDADSIIGLSQRYPPCNLEAEQSLLGAILANNQAFHRVVSFLKPDHFYDAVHGVIYREMARLILRGQLVDAVTLRTVFEQSDALADVGGTAYLAKLLGAMVGIINAQEYGRAVHDAWLRRQLINLGVGMVHSAFGAEPAKDGEAQIADATEALMELSSVGAKEAPEVSVGDAARLAVLAAEAFARGEVSGLMRTGLDALDAAIGFLRPSLFYILGGRPRMGKTSLALQIAISAARQLQREAEAAPPFSGAGGVAVIHSLEMSAEQLGGWAVCQLAGVANDILDGAAMTTAQAAAVLAAQRELDALPLVIVDAIGLSGPAMALRTRAINMRRRVRLVVVDHLQKVVAGQEGDRNGMTAATARTTSALKDLCRQIDCPVLALAQLLRDVDKRDDPRPRLADLMYAGESDADVAFFLFREELYLKRRPPERNVKESDEGFAKRRAEWGDKWEACKGRSEVIVAKRRQGPESSVMLGFDGPRTRFYQLGTGGDVPDAPTGLWER